MRVGNVIGTVTLSQRLEHVSGGRLLLVQPRHLASLRDDTPGTAEPVVAYDEISAGMGSVVAVSEGREAAMPFYPRLVPIDAYVAAVLDHVQAGTPGSK